MSTPKKKTKSPTPRKLRVCIAGVGLIGGSLGLALRGLPWVQRVIGLCRRESSARLALGVGAVDEATCDPRSALGQADLVVLAAPLGQFKELFQLVARHAPAGCVVTDAGSTKAGVCRMARRLLPATHAFVGSHPIAGSEQNGVQAARADLFQNRGCILCPARDTPRPALALVRRLWREVGMTVGTMSPAYHDRVLAQISHLPHVLASLLVLNARPEELTHSGPGFLSTTRIASGDADLWTDILRENPREISRSLKRLAHQLEQFRRLLDRRQWPLVRTRLNQARVRRDQLLDEKNHTHTD